MISITHLSVAFNKHPQIEMILDILSRKETYHIQIMGVHSKRIKLAFLKTLANYLNEKTAPAILLQSDFIYSNNYHHADRPTLLATDEIPHANMIRNKNIRFIFFAEPFHSSFVPIHFVEPEEPDLLSLLIKEKKS